MILFGIINPRTRMFHQVALPEIGAALAMAGLKRGHLDYGVYGRSADTVVGFAVYEFGLFVPPWRQCYFGLDGGRLVAGNAVVFQETDGRPADLDVVIAPRWFDGVEDIERAIAAGEVARPHIAVNGVELWRWPDPAPPDMAARMAEKAGT